MYSPDGALSLSISLPQLKLSSSGNTAAVQKPGAVFIQAAKPLALIGRNDDDKRKYDWDGCVRMCLQADELGKLVAWSKETPFEIEHTMRETGSQSFFLLSPRSDTEYIATVMRIKGESTIKVEVELHDGQIVVLQELARYLIPRLLGFDTEFGRSDIDFGSDRSAPVG